MDLMHICNRGILIIQKLSTLRIYIDAKATARDAVKSVVAMRRLVEIQDVYMMHLPHCVAEVKALSLRDPQLSTVRYVECYKQPKSPLRAPPKPTSSSSEHALYIIRSRIFWQCYSCPMPLVYCLCLKQEYNLFADRGQIKTGMPNTN